MALTTKKPNEFDLALLPLTGEEEVYSQTNGISEKYTVENIKDYVLPFLTGVTVGETLAETLVLGNATGGNDIEMTSGDQLTSSTSDAKVDLDSFGADQWFIGHDDGTGITGITSFIVGQGDSNGIIAGYQVNSFGLELSETTMTLGAYDVEAPAAYSTISSGSHQSVAESTLSSPSQNINSTLLVIANVTENRNSNITIPQAVMINSEALVLSGVTHSVAVGGQGLQVKSDYTAYANQMSFQEDGISFDTILKPYTATKDNSIVLPNTSGILAAYNMVETSVSMTATDGDMLIVNSNGSAKTIMLPTPIKHKRVFIKKIDELAGIVTVNGNGFNIDGSASLQLQNRWEFMEVVASDAEWFIVAINF